MLMMQRCNTTTCHRHCDCPNIQKWKHLIIFCHLNILCLCHCLLLPPDPSLFLFLLRFVSQLWSADDEQEVMMREKKGGNVLWKEIQEANASDQPTAQITGWSSSDWGALRRSQWRASCCSSFHWWQVRRVKNTNTVQTDRKRLMLLLPFRAFNTNTGGSYAALFRCISTFSRAITYHLWGLLFMCVCFMDTDHNEVTVTEFSSHLLP